MRRAERYALCTLHSASGVFHGNARRLLCGVQDASGRKKMMSRCRGKSGGIICLIAILSAGSQGATNPSASANGPVIHDEPVVFEHCCVLGSDGLCSPRYLFDSVVTNEYRGGYDVRERGIVDIDMDGHDDVILSDPESSRGTGGISYSVFLWTNGLFRCIGTVGGSGIRVERSPQGSNAIWSYWHCSSRTGSFCRSELNWRGDFRSTTLDVEWAEDGEPSIAKTLDEAIARHANVPIRWEVSRTVGGTNVWKSVRR